MERTRIQIPAACRYDSTISDKCEKTGQEITLRNCGNCREFEVYEKWKGWNFVTMKKFIATK